MEASHPEKGVVVYVWEGLCRSLGRLFLFSLFSDVPREKCVPSGVITVKGMLAYCST